MNIYLDLDGVLADFTGAACAVHGRPKHLVRGWNWYRDDWGMSDECFWHPIETLGSAFYANYVRPFPWAYELLNDVRRYGHVIILTASPLHPGLAASKVEWIKKHLGAVPVMTTCGNRDVRPAYLKGLLAGPESVLIDDSDDNTEVFRRNGGRAILFPQPWNALRTLSVRLRLQYVEDCLQNVIQEQLA